METKTINFDKSLKELDEIVDKISSQSLPLDESLKLYERAKEITSALQKALDEYKGKVETIDK